MSRPSLPESTLYTLAAVASVWAFSTLPAAAADGASDAGTAEPTDTGTPETTDRDAGDTDGETGVPEMGPEPVETAPPSVGRLPADCLPYLKDYLSSASRKLFRALEGDEFDLSPVDADSSVDLPVRKQGGTIETVTFEVLFEGDRRIAAFVDRTGEFRRTFVAARTGVGPIITSFLWPKQEDADDDSNCQPRTSRIEFPLVPMSPIDIEPFKFWGLRVVWRLPHSFKLEAAAADRSVLETLREVLSLERTAGPPKP